VLKKRKVENHDDFISGLVSPKEYKDTVAELNGSRMNRVFEFFKLTAPEHLGFAMHREAAERKAVTLAAAEVDTADTAMSPRTGGPLLKKATKMAAPAAVATTAAEVKPRKKWGTGPTDSPTTAKKTCFMDLDTGVMGAVIAFMSLRAAAPPGGAGGETGSPLLATKPEGERQ
jgi:hypothetical protein